MGDANERPFRAGRFPITELQLDVLVTLVADLCQKYRIPVTRRTVLSHAEVQTTLGIRQNGKWDISWLPGMDAPGDPVAVGDKLRARILAAMGQPAIEAAAFTPVLRRGSKGEAVRHLQERLTGQGHALGKVDSDFGERTDAAVRIFQKLEQLKPDGIVGPQTWAALNKGQ
ncbi:N-acetylmuramoyl-L-alanine amidase [Paracoccus cavernae]|uniref:N-acetylmuramoyl-L-alanine amidase n=2 Tax=Paracoccus cavernae TaxID=1571207 RepID=A0ABT8D6G4_9RHOB|nr:N-acetylmuramoyl-L-alanine amidase [Paracoccus cavernae]